jgi:hypothetical protein
MVGAATAPAARAATAKQAGDFMTKMCIDNLAKEQSGKKKKKKKKERREES